MNILKWGSWWSSLHRHISPCIDGKEVRDPSCLILLSIHVNGAMLLLLAMLSQLPAFRQSECIRGFFFSSCSSWIIVLAASVLYAVTLTHACIYISSYHGWSYTLFSLCICCIGQSPLDMGQKCAPNHMISCLSMGWQLPWKNRVCCCYTQFSYSWGCILMCGLG